MFTRDSLKKFDFGERLLRRNPFHYPAAQRLFDELEKADFETRRGWTESRLRTVLRAAMKTPYGCSVGGQEHYGSWPLLNKHTVRDRPQDLFAQRTWLAANASTGGTTGEPVKLVRSMESVAVEQACLDRLYTRLDINPLTARIAVLRGDNIVDPADTTRPFWRSAFDGRRRILSSNLLTAANITDYAQVLEEFKPDLLYVYPSSLETLCQLLNKTGRRLRIPRILSSSEVLRPEAWYLARKMFGCTMIDYYGQAERLAFAYATEPRMYRFLPGYAHVELLPVEHSGAVLYEIIGTTLWNLTMPLVRYRTGDLIRLPASFKERELEEVTLGLRPFVGVMGREQEVLIGSNGVRLTGINHIPRDVENVLRIQVVQETLDEIRILVIPGHDYSEADGARLVYNTRLKVPSSMKINIETTDRLERTPRGKTPLVIHRPAVQEALKASYT